MLNVVTGAFSYSGKYITRRLLEMGEEVRTLTGHPDRPDPFGGRVEAHSFNFDDPVALRESLQGASTLYNTYWIRFSYGSTTFDRAIQNTLTLFKAAGDAGVRRIVHVSIANPSLDSPLPYYRAKAIVEEALTETGVSFAIIRPTVIFGREDILINNIAYFLRRFPLFPIPGSGRYRLQPVYVEDYAEIVVDAGHRTTNVTIDAVGPESYAYEDLVRHIAEALDSHSILIHVPPAAVLLCSKVIGRLVGDVVLTSEEIDGLMADLLISHDPPTGRTRLSEWLAQNLPSLGAQYASEVERHYR
ncbi:MAG: SDR family oxidoreductase [Gemmatimonadota bacterium]